MAGNTLASLMTKITVDTGGVDKSFKLIKGGLQDADSKLTAFKTAVSNSSKEMQKAKIALDTYRLSLKNADNVTDEMKNKQKVLETSYKQSQIALANNKLELQKYQTQMDVANGSVSKFAGAMTMLKVAGIGAVITALGALTVGTTKTAASFEQLYLSFDVLIGSKEKAQAFTNELINLANVTPMTTEGLAKNAKMLLAMGESINNVIPDLKMLGDVSGGDQEKLDSLALVFGQVGARGRLTGDNLRQMQEQGFDPLNIIAKKTGETMAEVQDRMQRGLIPFSEFKETLVDATSKGGRFYQMMDKQSLTLNGRLSTMKDKWQLVGNAIGQAFLPFAKMAVNVVIKIADATMYAINALSKLKNKIDSLSPTAGYNTKSGISQRASAYRKQADELNKLAKDADARGAKDRAASYRQQAKEWIDAATKAEKQLNTTKKKIKKTQSISSGFMDSGSLMDSKSRNMSRAARSTSTGGSTKTNSGQSADSIISARRDAIQAESEYEIAKNNLTEQAKLEKQLQTQQRITALYKTGSIDYTRSKTDELQITNQIEDLKVEAAKKTKEEQDKLAKDAKDKEVQAAKDVAGGITDGLKSAIDGTKTLSESFKDMLLTMVADLARVGIENKLKSLFQGASTGNASGGSIFQGIYNVASILGLLSGFATGGYPSPNKPFIAGENGAELIAPTGMSTRVYNAAETSKIMGGAGGTAQQQNMQPVLVTNTFQVQTMRGDKVMDALKQPEAKAQILQSVRDAIRFNHGQVRTEVKNAK